MSNFNEIGKMANINIDKLELSVRTRNCLERKQIKTIFELLQNSESELLKIDGFGVKALKETRSALEIIGVTLFPLSVVKMSKRELSILGDIINAYIESLSYSYSGGGDCSGGG